MNQQLSILEHKVFDGRKPRFKTTFIPLAQTQTEAPCFECPELLAGKCDSTICHKLTQWIIES
jgi:hypothetical protein